MMLNSLYNGLRNRRRGHGALSPKTASYIHTIVHKTLADAVEAGLIHTNVADRIRPPRPSQMSSRSGAAWDEHELARFLADCAPGTRLEAIWRLTAMTGMRRGELLGLRWRDIDLGAGRLAVRRTLVLVAYQVVESTPKGHVARTIDLDSKTVSALRAHRERQQADREEWGTDYHEGDLVAAREDGSPIHPDTFSRSFAILVRDAGLRPIRLHDLRHTHATLALKAGAPVNVVSERLGHASPAFTLKHYAHVLPGMQAAAAAAVAALVRDHGLVA
jgi:integrase